MVSLNGRSQLRSAASLEQLVTGHGVVRRDGLFERLSVAASRVVLVCAPAGSGKTVLLRSWIEAAGLHDRVAWVSVDRAERDGQRFWLSVIDALAGPIGAVRRVDPAPGFRGEAVIEQLFGKLESVTDQTFLVIDDLHELRSADAKRWLEVFIARLPPVVRVVLATREDPHLGLHRLRLAGELTELRGPDLRFSEEETVQLLAATGITLSDGGVALLHERTEGWAAGLRLAAISLANHPYPERFVTEFSGSERTVAEYLLAEVLEREPAEVRELLLHTSVLERVSGPLADFLTGSSGSERILQELEDANAFVTSVDAGRSWFRYHHLFADLLQLELRRTAPAAIGALHRAASQWYKAEGYTIEAIRHAQAARDWPHASRLLADSYLDLTLDGRVATVRELLRAFPGEVAAADAELAIIFATARLLEGAFKESAAYLDLARGLSDSVAEERKAQFELKLAELTLVVARWCGDLESVREATRAMNGALASLPVGEHSFGDAHRAIALENLGIAELWSSRLDDARRHLEEALSLARRAGRPWLEMADLGHLGIAGPWTGLSFYEGLELSEKAVELADAHGWSDDPAAVSGLATGALALLWLGRFDEAEPWLERAERTIRPEGEPGIEMVVHHGRGLLQLARGRLEGALVAFGDAEHMQTLLSDKHPFALRTQVRRLQAQARLGQLADARAALAKLSEEDRHTAEVRLAAAVIHLADGEPQRAVDVLAPVTEECAPAMHKASAAVEAHLQIALAREQLGDRSAAEASLERALELAEPEGLVLPFVLAPVKELLEGLPRHRTAHPTLRQTILDVHAGLRPRLSSDADGLPEDLSEAELRVVRYLPSNLRAPEIAAELFVSTNTVRTHLRHIYAKLDAHGRAEAVARARELGLLAPSHGRR